VKKSVFEDHYTEMEKEVKKMKKLENIKNDDLRQEDYFTHKSIEKARMAFKLHSQMLKNITGNLKNKHKKGEDKLKCHHCDFDVVMTQSHCLEYTDWVNIKNDLPLTKIDDIVQFFQ
jgi:benzoyl-CoA reductase/2-hydroxyglutaryl-CoA dehydratase subunit BcrC/BadD/HgdB